jgi:Dolichyl-phosphate-mannose-protein mannosyltransferase
VSAVASQPLVAIRTVAIRVAVAPLTVIVVVSAVVRTLVAWSRATPAYFPDEYMYSEFGRSIAHGHLPAVRGVSAHFLPILMPLITAPGWLLPTVDEGYRAVQAIDATFMSLAAIPIYLLARRLDVSPRLSLVAAALSLTIPSLMLSSFIVSEPIAYPIVFAAIFAAVHALDKPSWRSYSLFLVFAALAALTRMQFAVLLPCFLLAVFLLALRERRLLEFLRLNRVPLTLFVVVAGGLLALGPARNTGYYPSLFYIPGFHLGGAATYLGADLVVLIFASGFVLIPGAILGLWLCLTKPHARKELAFAILAVIITVALLVEAVVYGNIGFVQERYLFYLLPLWTIAFMLYAQRHWPLKIAHGIIAALLVAAALAQPLSKYAVGGGQQHSAFLFALNWFAKPAGSMGDAAVIIAYAAGAGLVIIVGLAFRWPRLVTPFALGFALLATTGASVAATKYDQTNAHSIKSVVLGEHPSFVDESGVGPTALLVLPGGRIPDAKLFWNTSLDRLLLLPGMKPADSFSTETVDVANSGIVTNKGTVVTGPVLIDDWGTTVELQQATLVKSSVAGSLYKTGSGLRLRLLAFGRYADGWLGGRGTIIIWPTVHQHGLAGRLVMTVRGPTPESTATISFLQTKYTPQLTFKTTHNATRTISINICSSGPVTLPFTAGPIGGLGDQRAVVARTGRPHFVPDPAACKPKAPAKP